MANDTGSAMVGALMWVVLFYPLWSPSRRAKRKQARLARHAVSRNRTPYPKDRIDAVRDELREQERMASPLWAQDKPMPECFDNNENEDDL